MSISHFPSFVIVSMYFINFYAVNSPEYSYYFGPKMLITS